MNDREIEKIHFAVFVIDALSAYYKSDVCRFYNDGIENVLYLSPVLIAEQIMDK